MHPLTIPEHWSPEQALAVYAFLQDLSRQISQRYPAPLTPLSAPDPGQTLNASQLDLFDAHEPLPPHPFPPF